MVSFIESTKESLRQERETSASLSRTGRKLLSAKNMQPIKNHHSFKAVAKVHIHKGTFIVIL